MPRIKFKEPGGKEFIGEIDYALERISDEHNNKKIQFRLSLIYLEENFRGRGYGTMMMEQLLEKAKSLGCHSMIINLTKPDYDYYSSYEERRRFFNKLGFRFDEEGEFGRLRL